MNKKIIIPILIILLLIAGAILFIKKPNPQPAGKVEENVKIISPAEQEKNYETDAAKIMKNYFSEKELIAVAGNANGTATVDNAKWLDLIAKTKNDLLALHVPVKYKDLHLNLILGLSAIEQGTDGDKNKIAEGEEKISQTTKDYPWLRE